ncbi:LacI family DNA-binding transcriptional regulator [Alkaliphilus serpentinus]|uniref:LacI family transcriptional regulator n=1 Tax=Alkaliphilus serpentinus TaxID=1482731 RepID=A0A833HQH9_9FIRM|nr:LacI family DNA-binding transcriptional regulator [Alkaliphilus serpentinus]KAB3531092.1 LacI family transcriptional regulator [Alkaliphilus serpentinus]
MNIKDIAAAAGVAVSTVSRVINNHPDVNEATRKKVLEIIEDLNYVPNNSARNLKRIVSNNIGIFVKGIYNPYFAKMIQEIGQGINSIGYSIITHYNPDDANDSAAIIEFIKEKRLRALVCLGGEFEDLTDDLLKEVEVPILFISSIVSSSIDESLYSSFAIDNISAAYEAVNYLCRLGHSKIGIITSGSNDNRIGGLRFRGYLKALEVNEITYHPDYLEYGLYTFEEAYRAMNKLLDKKLELTAIFAISDIMAIGAAKAILDRGLRIPEDISVMGFDDIDYSAYFHPSITTVNQMEGEIIHRSVILLKDLINKEGNHQHVRIPTKIIDRQSCRQIRRFKKSEDLLF